MKGIRSIINEYKDLIVRMMYGMVVVTLLMVGFFLMQSCAGNSLFAPDTYEEVRAEYNSIKEECLEMYNLLEPDVQAYYKEKYWHYFEDAEKVLDAWEIAIKWNSSEDLHKTAYLELRKIILKIIIKELTEKAHES